MIRAISNSGPGPGYHALRTHPLQKLEAKANLESGLEVWRKNGKEWTGFVLSSDGWDDVTGKALFDIVLSTPKGSKFVEAVNATGTSTLLGC